MEGSKTETSAMANLNPALPQDVITDILVRLPVKSIGRFRCVSKPWKSLLTSPRFTKDHLNFHMDDPEPEDIIFSAGSDTSSSPYILTFTPGSSCDGIINKVNCAFEEISSLRVSDSCHGLVLLTDQRVACPRFLMNPITLEAIEVPAAPLSIYDSLSLSYDSSSDDYKIVALNGFEKFVDIYSVKDKTWRRIGEYCSYMLHKSPSDHQTVGPGVFHNGYLYWIAYYDDETSGLTLPVILAFSLAAEEFEEVPFPRAMRNKLYDLYAFLRSLGGYLALVNYTDCNDVWMMKEYGVQSSWTNPMSVPIFITERSENFYFKVVCLLGEDEIVFDHSIPSIELAAYNWRNGVKRGLVFAGVVDSDEIHSLVPFRGSLLSPN